MSTHRKAHALDKLLTLRAQARADGRVVVHCHGCFDIVHPGHIKHLEFARSLGDVLVVSISADSHVNKGLARPLIPQELRAASLAALECVDWVHVNDAPTAVALLEKLEPDVYVKGKEYERNADPRFLAERDAVARHGGRVVFSSGDIVFSSTALIGSLESRDPFHEDKVAMLRDRYELTDLHLTNLVHRFRGQRVVVVGDYILDRYHFCDATGVASEGPMMTLRPLQQKDYDGGAGVVALHMAAMGATPTLVSALADDEESSHIELRLRSAGVDVLPLRNRRQVVSKHRYVVDSQKLFKVDHGSAAPLDTKAEQVLADQVLAASTGAAAVVFADFGYGTISAGLLDRVLPTLRATVPVLAADVSGRQGSLLRFREMDLLCPTEREVRETLQDFSSGLGAVVWNLLATTKSRSAVITLGKQGLVTFDAPTPGAAELPARLRSEYVPALATRAVDPMGCGDALLATATLALAAGGSLQAATLLGSVAAAVEAQCVGNQPVGVDRLLEKFTRNVEPREQRLAS